MDKRSSLTLPECLRRRKKVLWRRRQIDYEKMSKFQKVISDESSVAAELEAKVEELRKQLSTEQGAIL